MSDGQEGDGGQPQVRERPGGLVLVLVLVAVLAHIVFGFGAVFIAGMNPHTRSEYPEVNDIEAELAVGFGLMSVIGLLAVLPSRRQTRGWQMVLAVCATLVACAAPIAALSRLT